MALRGHTHARIVTAIACSWLLVQSSIAAGHQKPANSPAPGTSASVLFMCPHGAAKSVLASAYFEKAARERGLNVRVLSAGTDPDEQVSPAVAAHLAKNGYAVPSAKPRRATKEDFANADLVISIGCDIKALPAPHQALRDWSDVPDLSAGFNTADDRIRERVMQLVEELLRSQKLKP